jgi:hypothetical protein
MTLFMKTRSLVGRLVSLAFALASAVLISGCITKTQARQEAQVAYLAGQRDGMLLAQQQPSRGPVVTFLGPVNNPVVNWTAGLTLSQAIVAAVYAGPANPTAIFIRRGTTLIPVELNRLLAGEDTPVLAGDIVELRQ